MTQYSKSFALCVMVDDKGVPVFDRHGQPRTLVFDPDIGLPFGFVECERVQFKFTLPPAEVIAERWQLSLNPKGTS